MYSGILQIVQGMTEGLPGCFGGRALQDHCESPLAESTVCIVECVIPHTESLIPVPSLQASHWFGWMQTGVLNEFI